MNKENIIFHGNENANELIIAWYPTHYCNYNCSYCISHSPIIKKDIKFVDISILKNTADKIFKMNKEKYTFIFSGGEPTIYPYFMELIKYISFNNKSDIFLSSNSHKNTNYFSELFKINNFNLIFSIHLEYTKMEHIKDVIKCANNFNKYIMLSLMVNPELKEKCKLFFDELLEYRKKYYFGLDLGMIHDNKKLDSRYTEDDIKWFYNSNNQFEEIEKSYIYNGNIPNFFLDYNTRYIFENNEKKYISHREAIVKDLKNFKDFYCCMGINSISIYDDGSYKGAECQLSPIVGNIYKDEIDFFKLINLVKCSLEGCDCRVNNYTPKFKNKSNDNIIIDKYIDNIIPKHYMHKIIMNLQSDIASQNKKINKLIDNIAWCIPIKKLRDNFRNQFK